MKHYKILCKEVTGIKGKTLTNGRVYPEWEFAPGVAAAFANAGLLEEVVCEKITIDGAHSKEAFIKKDPLDTLDAE